MSTRNYTSIEQSKKLLELGLPRKTADCSFRPYYYDPVEKKYLYFENRPKWEGPVGENDIPCCSLGALLDVTPSIDGFKPVIDLDINLIRYEGHLRDSSIFDSELLIKSVFNMICWLLENNYIKKGE